MQQTSYQSRPLCSRSHFVINAAKLLQESSNSEKFGEVNQKRHFSIFQRGGGGGKPLRSLRRRRPFFTSSQNSRGEANFLCLVKVREGPAMEIESMLPSQPQPLGHAGALKFKKCHYFEFKQFLQQTFALKNVFLKLLLSEFSLSSAHISYISVNRSFNISLVAQDSELLLGNCKFQIWLFTLVVPMKLWWYQVNILYPTCVDFCTRDQMLYFQIFCFIVIQGYNVI